MNNCILKLSHLISIIVICISCSNIEQSNCPDNYTFENEEIIALPITESAKDNKVPFQRFQYCTIDGVETLIAYVEEEELSFYDISSKKIFHSINLLEDRDLHAFEYINKDSILLMYGDPIYDSAYYDTKRIDGMRLIDTLKFQLIDYDGNIKRYYHFTCDSSNFENTNFAIEQVLPPFTHMMYEKIVRVGDIVFLFPFEYGHYNFDRVANNAPFIAYYNLKTEKFIFSKHPLPNLKDKMYYPSDFDVLNICISSNNLPLLRFAYSPEVFEWDYINDKFITHSLKSKLIDTIPPLAYRLEDMDAVYANYLTISYDPSKNLYYSIIEISKNLGGARYTIIADKNFNYINETPKTLTRAPEYVNGEIIMFAPATLNDTIYVVKTNLLRGNSNQDSITMAERVKIDSLIKVWNDEKKKMSEMQNPLQAFFEQKVDNHESSYCLVTIYAQDGCPSCRQEVTKIIADNQDILSEVPLFLIITGTQKDIDEELKSIKLNKFNKIIIDDNSYVKRMPIVAPLLNPRLTIVKNNIVVHDSIYGVADIEEGFIPNMLDACGLMIK